ncbi:hypothetical protein BC831DRAFT_452188 [Entophlyctis helioformis]|nr:hypothetical protein BC831DRAFT_452188 [Entophlyctis helioformis]
MSPSIAEAAPAETIATREAGEPAAESSTTDPKESVQVHGPELPAKPLPAAAKTPQAQPKYAPVSIPTNAPSLAPVGSLYPPERPSPPQPLYPMSQTHELDTTRNAIMLPMVNFGAKTLFVTGHEAQTARGVKSRMREEVERFGIMPQSATRLRRSLSARPPPVVPYHMQHRFWCKVHAGGACVCKLRNSAAPADAWVRVTATKESIGRELSFASAARHHGAPQLADAVRDCFALQTHRFDSEQDREFTFMFPVLNTCHNHGNTAKAYLRIGSTVDEAVRRALPAMKTARELERKELGDEGDDVDQPLSPSNDAEPPAGQQMAEMADPQAAAAVPDLQEPATASTTTPSDAHAAVSLLSKATKAGKPGVQPNAAAAAATQAKPRIVTVTSTGKVVTAVAKKQPRMSASGHPQEANPADPSDAASNKDAQLATIGPRPSTTTAFKSAVYFGLEQLDATKTTAPRRPYLHASRRDNWYPLRHPQLDNDTDNINSTSKSLDLFVAPPPVVNHKFADGSVRGRALFAPQHQHGAVASRFQSAKRESIDPLRLMWDEIDKSLKSEHVVVDDAEHDKAFMQSLRSRAGSMAQPGGKLAAALSDDASNVDEVG